MFYMTMFSGPQTVQKTVDINDTKQILWILGDLVKKSEVQKEKFTLSNQEETTIHQLSGKILKNKIMYINLYT